MDKRPFPDKSEKPGEDKIREVLGKSFLFYDGLNKMTIHFKKEWNFSKSSGWMQKVSDGKKALYYFIPLVNSFKLSMAIREQEKSDFLAENEYAELYDQLNRARKYPEGYALQFLINDEESFKPLQLFIKGLIEKRK